MSVVIGRLPLGLGEPLFEVRALGRSTGRFAQLTLFLALRDIRSRYRQSLLGIAWAVFLPILMVAVFAFMLGPAASRDEARWAAAPHLIAPKPMPYVLFALTGVVPWMFFTSSLNSGLTSLVANRNLVTKVRFPQESLPVSCIVAHAVDFAISAAVVAAYTAWCIYDGLWRPSSMGGWVWLPVIFIAQVAWTAGFGLLASLGYLFYRDVKPVVTVGLQLALFVSGVILPAPTAGDGPARLLSLNPMLHLLMGYRTALSGDAAVVTPGLAWTLGLTPVFLALAILLFRKASERFAEEA